ncbi:MAG: putative sporulation protein YtxC [Bacillota bacterium]|nr:putative sporulation protein YtxC [Bacillota bacterium]
MQFLSIGVNKDTEDIIEQIKNELEKNKEDHFKYSIQNEVNSNGSNYIVCGYNNERNAEKTNSSDTIKSILVLHISNALADYIIRKYEEKLIIRTISSNYCYFNSVEKKEILSLAKKIIKSDDKNLFSSLFHIRRHNIIVKKLLDYFENSNSIILDGFVNFRLKDYIKDLEEVVDKAVDDFLMAREYNEFIRLLRYFVDIQNPKFNLIHVVVGFDNKYILLDEAKKEITNECIREFVNEISLGEINYDDLLVSSLITLAPRKIVLHGTEHFRNKELLETIKNVFCGKVTLCSQCDVCSVNMAKSEHKK